MMNYVFHACALKLLLLFEVECSLITLVLMFFSNLAKGSCQGKYDESFIKLTI